MPLSISISNGQRILSIIWTLTIVGETLKKSSITIENNNAIFFVQKQFWKKIALIFCYVKKNYFKYN